MPDDGSEEIAYPVSRRSPLSSVDGRSVGRGRSTSCVDGNVDPHEVLRILGPAPVQLHLVDEVQEVYRSQGVSIHDKHIEIIIRQMLKRVNVLESGDTELLPGELFERARFEAENRRVVAEGGQPASARPVLMGITKASLATESWLSAASFQETTRVLTDAAINATFGLAGRPEGERHHRQAHPGRYGHVPLPQHPGRADRGGATPSTP